MLLARISPSGSSCMLNLISQSTGAVPVIFRMRRTARARCRPAQCTLDNGAIAPCSRRTRRGQQVDHRPLLKRSKHVTVYHASRKSQAAALLHAHQAPLSGPLPALVDAGKMVRGSDTTGIAVITQVDPISVLFTIPQDLCRAGSRASDRRPAGGRRVGPRQPGASSPRGSPAPTTDRRCTGTVRLKAQFPLAGKLFPKSS